MSRKYIDLTGKTFGLLTVIKKAAAPDESFDTHAWWLCRCACGRERLAKSWDLRHGVAHSCGCVRRRKGRQNDGK